MISSQSAFAKGKSAKACQLPRALESCICQEKATVARGEARGDGSRHSRPRGCGQTTTLAKVTNPAILD